MNDRSSAGPEAPLEPQATAPAALSPIRTLYWSVQRELWENRSLYVVPLGVAGLVLVAFLVGCIGLPARLRASAALDPAQQQAKLGVPFSMAASVIFLFTYVVGAFYSLEALYGERRDRSILFWKSMPVSDLTTVLAKACVPLLVLPVFIFLTVIATQTLMLFLSTLVALLNGLSAAPLWRVPLFRMSLVMIYGLIVHALWHAPLYAWLLLVSAWARRLPILWAMLPWLALGTFERIALGTSYVGSLIHYRVGGAVKLAFDFEAQGRLVPALTPSRFLASPGLWGGLAVAALCIAAAVRLRRQREPI